MYRILFCLLISSLCAKSYDVLSLSSAILDHFIFISDDKLSTLTNEKGNWAPIDYQTLGKLLKDQTPKVLPGGSGTNVMKGLAKLGKKCAIIGQIGFDEKGKLFQKSLDDLGIESSLNMGVLPTGQAICFITPDGERTFRTYIGAAHSLSDVRLGDKYFKESRHFHLEGYQLIDEDLCLQALVKAQTEKMTISIDLANPRVISEHKEFLLKILPRFIDFVFCNEPEAKALTGKAPKEAAIALAEMCKVSVVTVGQKGSYAVRNGEVVFAPAQDVNTIDLTGAGDSYASGFLYGLLEGLPLKECARIGTEIAANVVQVVGADIPIDKCRIISSAEL